MIVVHTMSYVVWSLNSILLWLFIVDLKFHSADSDFVKSFIYLPFRIQQPILKLRIQIFMNFSDQLEQMLQVYHLSIFLFLFFSLETIWLMLKSDNSEFVDGIFFWKSKIIGMYRIYLFAT